MPDWNRADLNGLVAACRTASRRVRGDVRPVRHRHLPVGAGRAAAAQLRRHEGAAARWCSRRAGRSSFTDYICDDGVGYGPYELKLSLTRTGDKVHLDFTGSSPQAAGPINYYINENLTRMFFGIYMITVADPQILWNDGFYPLVDVTIPDGSYWKPKHPGRAERAATTASAGCSTCSAACSGRPTRRCSTRPASPPRRTSCTPGIYSARRAQGGVVPAVLDRLRRHPRPAARRRAGRPLAVAELREHPLRVPRVLLPAADREVGDRRRHRRRRAAPRRQRRRRRLRLRGAGHDRDPRRPLAHLPVGRQRRRTPARAAPSGSTAPTAPARCCRASATTCRSRPATCCTSSPGAAAAGATRWSATRSWWRWRCGAAW